MAEEKVMNRWIVVAGAILIQLALGSIYSWGTLSVFLSKPGWLRDDPLGGADSTNNIFVFAVGLASFAGTMIFAGQLQQKIGPMKTAFIGGMVVGIGCLLSAVARNLPALLITYGLIYGAGIGFGYVCPIATAARWFPDMKGLINGLAVAGFGAGAFIFNLIIKAIANPLSLSTKDPAFHDVVSSNVPTVFIVNAVLFFVMVSVGALTMKLPPAGWKPEGYEPPAPAAGGVSRSDWTREQMIKTKEFFMLHITFLFSAISGLMVIGVYASFAISKIPGTTDYKNDIGKLVDEGPDRIIDFAVIGGLASLFNGLGRIFWGRMCDIFTYKKSMIVMFVIQSVLMIIYGFLGSSLEGYLIVTWALYFCFGGNFSIFPTATTDLFGTKFLGANYGVVFTAYGFAGILGSLLTTFVVKATGSYMEVFIVMGVMSAISACIAFFLKPPVIKEEGAAAPADTAV